jgi:hypothetical protein
MYGILYIRPFKLFNESYKEEVFLFMNFLITLITSWLFAAPANTSEKKEKVGVVDTIYNILDILYKKRIYLLHFIKVLNDMYSSENACYLKIEQRRPLVNPQ